MRTSLRICERCQLHAAICRHSARALERFCDRSKALDPRIEKLKKQADVMAKEEKKRLIREAKRRQ